MNHFQRYFFEIFLRLNWLFWKKIFSIFQLAAKVFHSFLKLLFLNKVCALSKEVLHSFYHVYAQFLIKLLEYIYQNDVVRYLLDKPTVFPHMSNV